MKTLCLLAILSLPLHLSALNLTFDTPDSVSDWTGGDLAETSVAWADGAGNPGGALQLSGTNTEDGVGKGFVFEVNRSGIDYMGATTINVSMDIKLASPLVGTALHLRTNLADNGLAEVFNIENQGLNTDTFTSLSFDFEDISTIADTATVGFTMAAGAFNGAGGSILVDNIAVTPVNPIPEPSQWAAIFGALVLVFSLYRRRSS